MKLSIKLVILVVVLVMAPALIIGQVTLREYKHSVEDEILASLHVLVTLKEAQLEDWATSLERQVEELSRRQLLIESVRALTDLQTDQDTRSEAQAYVTREHLLQAMRSDPLFLEYSIVNLRTWRVVASSDESKLDTFMVKFPTVSADQREAVFGEVEWGHADGVLRLLVSMPIIDHGELIGALIGTADLARISKIILGAEQAEFEENLYLVNSLNFFVTEPRHGSGTEYALRRTVRSGGVEAALAGIEAPTSYRDYRGETVFGVVRWLPAWDMALVAEIDAREALAPVRVLTRLSFAIQASSIIFFLAVGVYLVIWTLSRPIERLRVAALAIGEGALDHRIGYSRRDELGDLANTFDKMAGNLQEITASRDDLNEEIRQRKQAMAELQRSNEELEQFAYAASHDLQEPLRMIVGYIELVRKRYDSALDEAGREFIQLAIDGSERMKRLIQDLLTLSRVQRAGLQGKNLQLSHAVNEAKALLHAAILESSAAITADEMPIVWGDTRQLIQLFQNLIGNALKFRAEQSPRIHIGAIKRSDAWEISVADNGIGIDPKHADRVFMIFKRLHARTDYEGTGIGLALCRRIVERHGGRIWVESKLGQGSTFRFTIPHRNEPQAEESAQAEEPLNEEG